MASNTAERTLPAGRVTKLSVSNVNKVFETKQKRTVALADVNLDVESGEIVGLIGPSGCGKSTLLHIFAGLTDPTTGAATIDGRPIVEPGPDRCMVFQRVALFPHLTARKNVEYGLKLKKIPPAERKRIALEYMNLVGLGGFENAYPHELSGGMQQRVALARTLVLQPDLLLMDEPFAALDAQTRILMQELVSGLAKELGLTVVLVTHNVEEAVYLADRVFVMGTRPGHISEVVTVPHELWADRPVVDAEDIPEFLESRQHLSKSVRREVLGAMEASVGP